MKPFESYGVGIPGVDPAELTGWLIVIEGTDGVGRTTQLDMLRAHLQRQGYAVAETGLSRSDLASSGIDQAKQVLAELAERFPQSTAAGLARKRLKRLGGG